MRVQGGVLLVVLVALFSIGALLTEEIAASREDAATLYQKLFEELRKALPSHGVVGYISDRGAPGSGSEGRYNLTQYALAPVVVADEPRRLVVGDFQSPAAVSEILARNDLTVVQDFGNGAMLLRKRQK